MAEARKTRPISWVRPALREFQSFPAEAQAICLAALTVAAEGGLPDVAKPTESAAVVKTRLSRARGAIRRELLEHAGMVASNTFRFLRPRCDRVVTAVLSRIL